MAVPADPYVLALGWLARRELSTSQIRTRLARRGVEADAIDEAIARLTRERALDDTRVALAYARSAVTLKGRGRGRILREMATLGVARPVAEAAVQEVFGDVDEPALLEHQLAKRWPRGGAPLTLADKQRIYRALLRQGFSADKISAAFRARRVEADDLDVPSDPDD